jgi:hypothetical protein
MLHMLAKRIAIVQNGIFICEYSQSLIWAFAIEISKCTLYLISETLFLRIIVSSYYV